MTQHPAPPPPPLSRLASIGEIPGRGLDVTVTPTPDERDAVARDLGLVAVDALSGRFHLTRKGRVVHVEGEVTAEVQQTCIVTLDAFPATVREAVDVRYSEDAEPGEAKEIELTEAALDAPEPLLGQHLDLGVLTLEFLALGLDPYPRKPGASFDFQDPAEQDPSPFAALARLRDKPE